MTNVLFYRNFNRAISKPITSNGKRMHLKQMFHSGAEKVAHWYSYGTMVIKWITSV